MPSERVCFYLRKKGIKYRVELEPSTGFVYLGGTDMVLGILKTDGVPLSPREYRRFVQQDGAFNYEDIGNPQGPRKEAPMRREMRKEGIGKDGRKRQKVDRNTIRGGEFRHLFWAEAE